MTNKPDFNKPVDYDEYIGWMINNAIYDFSERARQIERTVPAGNRDLALLAASWDKAGCLGFEVLLVDKHGKTLNGRMIVKKPDEVIIPIIRATRGSIDSARVETNKLRTEYEISFRGVIPNEERDEYLRAYKSITRGLGMELMSVDLDS